MSASKLLRVIGLTFILLVTMVGQSQARSLQQPAAAYSPNTANDPVCLDALGCITIGPTSPVHIAYALFTIDNMGIDSRNGVEIAIDDAGGKILGHTIQFDGLDDSCDGPGGTAAGTTLAADPSIVAVVGTTCSSAARTAMPLLAAAGMVMVSPSNTAPDLTDPTSPNHYAGYFRTAGNDNLQGAAAADYAYHILGVRKAATLRDGGSYADGLRLAFANAFIALGGTITLQTSVSVGQTDMNDVLTSIAGGTPQMIYFPIFLPEAGYVITQARDTSGLGSAYLMGSDGLFTPDIVSAAGPDVEGFLVTSADFSYFNPAYRSTFLPAYRAKFGTVPLSSYHANAYDAFNLIKAAIQTVAVVDTDGSLQIGRQALREALYATSGFPGLTGALTCSSVGECGDPHFGVYRYHAGQDQPVKIWSDLITPLDNITIGPTSPVHIGYALFTSDNLGIDSRNGVEIAIDDAGGKILGHTIQFDGLDDGCNPSGGENAGTILAADPTIVGVVGTSCSSAARTAMPLLATAGMVMVSPSNTAPDLTDPSSPNHYAGYFRTAWNDKFQGSAAANFAYKVLGVRKAATLHDGSLYANTLQQVFADTFTALGGTVTLQTSISVGQTDMSPALTSVASGTPQLLYFPIFLPEGGYIITQARHTSGLENTYLMSSDGLYTPDIVPATGSDLEGFLVNSPDFSHFSPAYQSTFLPAYRAKFGHDPLNVYHAQAHDAFMLIKAAIQTVAVVDPDGSLHINRQALREALYATSGFPGLTGALTCSSVGECGDPHFAVYRYHAGQYPPVQIWSDFIYKIFLPLVRR